MSKEPKSLCHKAPLLVVTSDAYEPTEDAWDYYICSVCRRRSEAGVGPMATYRAFIDMTFEPDENGYLEWESEYGLSPEEMQEQYSSEPRTKEEMLQFFTSQFHEYLLGRHVGGDIKVEEVKE